jgi:hypothetical protein
MPPQFPVVDDRRAALLLSLLALAGAGVRLALAPAKAAAPGDVRLVSVDTPPPGGLRGSRDRSSPGSGSTSTAPT